MYVTYIHTRNMYIYIYMCIYALSMENLLYIHTGVLGRVINKGDTTIVVIL